MKLKRLKRDKLCKECSRLIPKGEKCFHHYTESMDALRFCVCIECKEGIETENAMFPDLDEGTHPFSGDGLGQD